MGRNPKIKVHSAEPERRRPRTHLGDGVRLVFDEARALCERDAAALWVQSLCGPILIVRPMDRPAIANRPNPGMALQAKGRGSLFETVDGLQQSAASIPPGFVVTRLVQCFDYCIDAQSTHGVDRHYPRLLEAPHHDWPQAR